MRRFMSTSMFVSVVLLAGAVCLAQDAKPDTAGAKSDSPDMWEAYKQMWEGQWETTITFSEDLDNGPKKGDTIAATLTNEVIVSGHGMLVTRLIRSPSGELLMEQKGLACWCPKQKAILLHELNTMGGRGESVIKLVDGQEHSAGSFIDADGNASSISTTTSVIDKDTNKIKIVDGLMKGFEIVYKRTKKQ